MSVVNTAPPSSRSSRYVTRQVGMSDTITSSDVYQTILEENNSRVAWNFYNKSDNTMWLRGFCDCDIDVQVAPGGYASENIKVTNVSTHSIEVKGTAGDSFVVFEDISVDV